MTDKYVSYPITSVLENNHYIFCIDVVKNKSEEIVYTTN